MLSLKDKLEDWLAKKKKGEVCGDEIYFAGKQLKIFHILDSFKGEFLILENHMRSFLQNLINNHITKML